MNNSGTYDIKRKVGISVILGFLSLMFAPYGINSIMGEITIDIPWSLVLPIVVAMAFGWQYGAIAGLSGGALFPFLLWANNGWGNLLTSIIFLYIYITSGFLNDTRFIKRVPKLPLRILLLVVPSSLVLSCYYIFQFNTALSFNPPFWQQYSIQNIPDEILYSFAIKDSINILILVLVAESLLRLPFVCKLLGLPTEVKMRENNKIFVASIITALFIWFLFAGLNFALLKSNHTFFNEHNTLALLVILSCGIFVSRMIFFFSESNLIMQSELNSSEKKYRELFEANKDGIAIFHIFPDGNLSNFIETNEAAGAMLGYTKAEMSVLKPLDLEIEGSDEKLMQRTKELQTKGFTSFDTFLKHKNGNNVPVEVNVVLINTSNPPVLMNITRDISERKQLEATFRDIIEKNPMSIQILDMEGYPIEVNSAHTKLFGVKPPPNYSIFNDTQLLSLGFDKLFDQIKKGEVVYFPDTYYNVHDVDPSFPDSPVWVKALGFTLNDIDGKPNKIVLMHENITERKNAGALLDDIIENNPLSIQIVDKEGYTLSVNPAFTELFGSIPPPEFSIFDDLKSKSAELGDLVSQVQNGGIVHLPDICFNAHNAVAEAPDVDLWIRALIFPLRNSVGKPDRFVLMHENITERKLAEQELIKAKKQAEENEEKFRTLSENSPAIIYRILLKPTFRFDYVSPAVTNISGYTPEDHYADPDLGFKLVHPDDRHILEQSMHKTKGEPIILRWLTKDGKTIWTEQRNVLVCDKAGNPIAIEGISTDITAQKEADAKIAFQAEILRQVSEAVIATDLNGSITFWNDSAEKLYGWKQEEVIGKSIIEVTPSSATKEQAIEIFSSLAKGENWKGSFTLKNKEGNSFPASVSDSPLFDSNNNFAGIIGISSDRTARMKAEEELIAAKQKAEESDRLKSAFLANMSHEIRTPMNGILGFSELLQMPGLSGDQQQEYIGIIRKSGMRMLNIINDIVDISKIEAGLMKLNSADTNINEQIEYIYAFFKPEVEAKGMKLLFKTTLSAKEATISTDREKVYAIFTNLVKNAIKYSKDGSIEIGYKIVETQCIASLQFYVKDNGIGIPPSRHEAIFERFIQADISDKMARQGAGLGLAITKSYVSMLGGKIWVESQEGEGSTFYFTLPYIQKAKPAAFGQPSDPGIEKPIWTKKLKILVAEDDQASELLISLMVNTLGKEILRVDTGIEAIETCRNNPDIDLVLMDIQMPEMGGYEATRQIRAFNKNVVIIAQTAYGLSGDREKAIEAGCNDYIPKPINKAELLEMIRKHCPK